MTSFMFCRHSVATSLAEEKVYCLEQPDWEIKYEYIDEGTEVVLKGSIKEHSEYDGQKQTVLTRCKVM